MLIPDDLKEKAESVLRGDTYGIYWKEFNLAVVNRDHYLGLRLLYSQDKENLIEANQRLQEKLESIEKIIKVSAEE